MVKVGPLKEKLVLTVVSRLILDEERIAPTGGEVRSTVDKKVVITVPEGAFGTESANVQLQVLTTNQ